MSTMELHGVRFPRFALLDAIPPIQRLARLEAALGERANGVRLHVKRDDHFALGGGGNKLRKLELHLGQALADGADTVITVGGLQSNHARLTAAAAALAGLRCELVLSRAVPRSDDDYEHNGNLLLDALFGATVRIAPDGTPAIDAAQARADELRAAGRKVRVIPTGGSTGLGSLGYAACAAEIVEQERALGIEFSGIVCPNGSGGTQAGLVAGLHALGRRPERVLAHGVLAPAPAAAAVTVELVEAACALLELAPPPAGAVRVDGAQRGEGYGVPTDGMLAAVRLMARTQGLLLDPVYGGKAFAGLLADVEAGKYRPGDDVLFLMTGGQPGLYAYRTAFEAGGGAA
ncbi:D-cysteine desulfhydrase family protein [Burkholderia perseverans]|uniref:D-cysteine desulfhydrase family protein n=1 Tax=Burkholderia perseverans TaxID=2615214 RepID=UPI001FED70F4|nr:D-cysteine desulfhydrase family protein [Burkholderia perseverans]